MFSMIFPMMIIITISLITMKLSMIISKKKKTNFEKMSPFECGFNPMLNSRMPFSLNFFLITIIFLIFDVEIALLMPMIYTLEISNILMWSLTSLSFLMILLMGLMHEWNQGALNWL